MSGFAARNPSGRRPSPRNQWPVACAFQRSVDHVHIDLLSRGAANVSHFTGRKRSGRYRRLRSRTDREGRWKDRIKPGQRHKAQCLRWQPSELPQPRQGFARVWLHINAA